MVVVAAVEMPLLLRQGTVGALNRSLLTLANGRSRSLAT